MKFTISIPRESCTNAKAKYSSSVVPPDPSVHFYHWLREALCVRDESDFVSYTCRYCPVLAGCIHMLLREALCVHDDSDFMSYACRYCPVLAECIRVLLREALCIHDDSDFTSIHAVIVLCWQDAFTCCYVKHYTYMMTVIS